MTTNPDRAEQTTELCTTVVPPAPTLPDRAPGMRWSFRTDRRVLWVGYHSPELAGVLIPVALVVLWGWPVPVLAVSGVIAALWGGHEYRQRGRRDKSSRARPAALTPDQATGTQTASDDEREASRGHLA